MGFQQHPPRTWARYIGLNAEDLPIGLTTISRTSYNIDVFDKPMCPLVDSNTLFTAIAFKQLREVKF